MTRNDESQRFGMWTTLMALGLATGSPVWAQPAPASPAAGPICVAVIEPDVSPELRPARAKVLAGSLDTLLTENLAAQKDFTLVDRQALDKVLEEKALKMSGAAKIAATDVAEPLRRFWTAGVLVCSRLEAADPKQAAAGPVSVSVEAVAAQTGQLLAELHFTAKRESAGEAAPRPGVPGAPPEARLSQFWQTVRRNAARAKDLPLVEVPETQLVSSLPRLQWMADDLADSLRAVASASRQANLLTFRRPTSTREERLLRVMGLAVAKSGDSVASLAPAPDMRLASELKEEQATGVSFGKTPVAIRLQWQAQGEERATHELKGTVGEYEELRKQALLWFQSRLAGGHHVPMVVAGRGKESPPADEEEQARQQAKEELAAIGQLVEAFGGDLSNGWYLPPWSQELRAAIARRALRATHLDPTSEEAAFYAALTVDSLYFLPGQERSQACHDRTILECRRYLARFRRPLVLGNHTCKIVGQLASEYQAICDLQRAGDGWEDSPDREAVYRYADVVLPAMAEVDVLPLVPGGPLVEGNIWVLAHLLTEAIFLICPEDELEAQHQWWQKYWEKEIKPLGRKDLPTWEYASLGYHVRKKDVAGLRQALTSLGQKGPEASRWLWEGPGSPARARRYLREAGDPAWKTWKPEITAPGGIDFKQWNAYFGSLSPPMPPLWEYAGAPPFTAEMTVTFPPDVVSYGISARYMREQAPIQPLCVAQTQLWLCAPGLLKQDLANLQKDFRLYTTSVGQLEQGGGAVAAQLLPVPWPELPAALARKGEKPPPLIVVSAAVDQGPQGERVWIGTRHHGLACFSKEGQQWHGRWYADEAGLPALCVVRVAPCLYEGKHKLLLTVCDGDPTLLGDRAYLVVLDPATAQTTILLNSTGRRDLQYQEWAAVWPSGAKVPLRQYRRDLWPDLDFKDVKQYVGFAVDPWFPEGRQVWLSGRDAKTGAPGAESNARAPLVGAGRPRIWGADAQHRRTRCRQP